MSQAAKTQVEQGTPFFSRGRTQLAPCLAGSSATGHRLTAFEARETYGEAVITEAIDYGSAILTVAPAAAAKALKDRRVDLGISAEVAEKVLHLPVSEIEQDKEELGIQRYEQLAMKLGLDERLLSFELKAGADRDLGVRLRTLQAEPKKRLSVTTVLNFAEAASLVRVHNRLGRWLGLPTLWDSFTRSNDYGDANTPAFKVGYELATQARKTLVLNQDPIPSMRDLVESQLGVPVVQRALPKQIAGATISNGSDRGIVLNTVGPNGSVWVRRATLAHELGHLLFDPEQTMQSVRVDLYEQTDLDPETAHFPDYVEQRANAFAMAFLAPSDAVKEVVQPPLTSEKIVQAAQFFGMSLTAARYHVANSYWRQYEVPQYVPGVRPEDHWFAAEDYTLDYFRPEEVPEARRGRFSGLVAASYLRGLISADTGALYLDCPVELFESNAEAIATLFPIS